MHLLLLSTIPQYGDTHWGITQGFRSWGWDILTNRLYCMFHAMYISHIATYTKANPFPSLHQYMKPNGGFSHRFHPWVESFGCMWGQTPTSYMSTFSLNVDRWFIYSYIANQAVDGVASEAYCIYKILIFNYFKGISRFLLYFIIIRITF